MGEKMAKYDGNAAYNFEMFEPQKQRTEPQIKVIHNQKHRKIQNRNFMLRVLTYAAIFLVGMISILFNQIAITEVTNQVSEKTKELETLQNEYRMLQNEMESSVALANIETIVTRDMGMVKLDESQITYVNLSEGDAKVVPNDSDAGFFSKTKNSIRNLVEYISAQ